MLATLSTFCIDGLDTRRVSVEVDIRLGLPAFTIVGLGDAAVREARERVRAALANSGFDFPQRRITVNLAPAHLRKAGSGFDVAIACGILAASGQVPPARLEALAVFGELSLDGSLRGCRGSLAVAEATRRARLQALVLPAEHAEEAALVDGLEVVGLADLQAFAAFLEGGEIPEIPAAPRAADAAADLGHALDLADVRGHVGAIAALSVAAAGGHNLLLKGPPGTGKTMLARRMPSILPPLTRAEALEVTRIRSLAGLRRGGGLEHERPFRAPHHTISPSGLVGGGAQPTPGEATLAHHGVLFLDELSEFARSATEALRQPLEDGRVAIVRGQRTAIFPTRFMLVAATNPCPCGHLGDERRCRCSETDLARHVRRLSGPLLDRLDIVIVVERPEAGQLGAGPVTDSATVRASVAEARERQRVRLAGEPVTCNAHLDAAGVRRTIVPTAVARRTLDASYARGTLSARGRERALKVARTIADLDGSERVQDDHMLQALSFRGDAPMAEAA